MLDFIDAVLPSLSRRCSYCCRWGCCCCYADSEHCYHHEQTSCVCLSYWNSMFQFLWTSSWLPFDLDCHWRPWAAMFGDVRFQDTWARFGAWDAELKSWGCELSFLIVMTVIIMTVCQIVITYCSLRSRFVNVHGHGDDYRSGSGCDSSIVTTGR